MPSNPNDITAYRRKRKTKAIVIKSLAVVLVLAAAAFVWYNIDAIMASIRGLNQRLDNKIAETDGFPVKLPGSASYAFHHFGTGFYLLTDTYLYTYTPAGNLNYAIQHGMSSPEAKASDNRILLYDRASYEFALYNRSQQVFSTKLDEKIVSARIGSGDLLAVVTNSAIYTNILYIYDKNGNVKYWRKFSENISGVAFAGNNKDFVVSTIGFQNGDTISNVYKYTIEDAEAEIWKYTLPVNTWAIDLSIDGDTVSVLGDEILASLDLASGAVNGYYHYSGTLKHQAFAGSFSVLLTDDKLSGSTMLLSLDKKATIIATKVLQKGVSKVEISGDMVYTLEGNKIRCYDKFLDLQSETDLQDEYQNFIIIDKQAYLLGYVAVDRVALKEAAIPTA